MLEVITRYFKRHAELSSAYAKALGDAKIRIGILVNWHDFEKDLFRTTPHGSCRWDNVAFVPLRHCPNPDFVLILNTPLKKTSFRIPPDRLWFACGEPPVPYFRAFHSGQGEFCNVIGNDDSVARHNPGRTYFLEPPILPSWSVKRNLEELSSLETIKKSGKLSWVTSDLSFLEGHKRRMKFLEALRKNVDFDLFGRGFTPLTDKWDGIAPYRYSIAFENTSAPRYFTEKIMDCFVCHTMPFYFGAPDIAKYFPSQSMVLIDPDDPKVFDKISEISASNLAEERLPFILEAKELSLKKYNMFARLSAHFNAAFSEPARPVQKVTLVPAQCGQ